MSDRDDGDNQAKRILGYYAGLLRPLDREKREAAVQLLSELCKFDETTGWTIKQAIFSSAASLLIFHPVAMSAHYGVLPGQNGTRPTNTKGEAAWCGRAEWL